MRWVRWLFGLSAVWGIAVVAPLYFLEDFIGTHTPPPITHPEYFYGFVGVTLASQLLYVLIATDPVRYRPLMLVGALGKLLFFAACLVLLLQGRIVPLTFWPVLPDLLLALLFVIAWARTPARS